MSQNIELINSGQGTDLAEPPAAEKPVLVVVPFGADQYDIEQMRRAVKDNTVRIKVAQAMGAAAAETEPDADIAEVHQKVNKLHAEARARLDDEFWLAPEFMPNVLDACYRRFGAKPRMHYGEA